MDKRIFSIVLFLVLSISLFSQEPAGNGLVVEVSKEKTTINGKTYYLHAVKKGENLYRISIAYGVKQKDIVIANPETISGNIKEGQILKIPVDPVTPRSIQYIESDNFIYHIAEEQQTIFSITQKYKVTQEELFKYNPELEFSPLQVGQVVRVPKKENVSENAESFRPIENYTDHKVRKRETKYSISKEYSITVDELIAANPELNTEDLKAGSIIKIPVKSNTQIETKGLIAHKDSLVLLNKQPVFAGIEPCNKNYYPYSGQFNIALLLPFSIEENETRAKLDSIAMANHPAKQATFEMYPRTVYSLEFYEGFLLAVDSLKKTGLSVNIYSYDTGKDLARVNKILNNLNFKNMDLIIGPFFTEGLEQINSFSLENGIALVSPIITNNKKLDQNPYAFQVIPNDSISVNKLLSYIKTVPDKKVILIKPMNNKDTTIFRAFKSQLDLILNGKYKILENKNSFNTISAFLAGDSIENIVLIPSTDEVPLMPLLARLTLDSKKFRIKVLGLPDITNFKKLDQGYLHSLEIQYYTPFYIDYNDPNIIRFYNRFRNKYNSVPQDFQKEGFNFAVLGYDIGLYFLNAIASKGKGFTNCPMTTSNMLHMIFDFEKDGSDAGYMNKGVQIIQFTKDYYIKKVN